VRPDGRAQDRSLLVVVGHRLIGDVMSHLIAPRRRTKARKLLWV